MFNNNHLILSIDLDEWYTSRFVAGFKDSRWKSLKHFFRDYYHSDKPIGEIIKPTRYILDVLNKKGIKATFFITGQMAEWYPDLVREIAKNGHEIACHGMYHQDIRQFSVQEFSSDLLKAKHILEDLIGRAVIGFRAPILIITNWLPKVLIGNGFVYDSSVCPSRKILGKFKAQIKAPQNPYRVSQESLLKKGDSSLIELPIPVFPFLKLPGAVSIATRVFGLFWTRITLNSALKKGDTCYYVHPYEFGSVPHLKNRTFSERLFFQRTGKYMQKAFDKILDEHKHRIISAEDYIKKEFNDEK